MTVAVVKADVLEWWSEHPTALDEAPERSESEKRAAREKGLKRSSTLGEWA